MAERKEKTVIDEITGWVGGAADMAGKSMSNTLAWIGGAGDLVGKGVANGFATAAGGADMIGKSTKSILDAGNAAANMIASSTENALHTLGGATEHTLSVMGAYGEELKKNAPKNVENLSKLPNAFVENSKILPYMLPVAAVGVAGIITYLILHR